MHKLLVKHILFFRLALITTFIVANIVNFSYGEEINNYSKMANEVNNASNVNVGAFIDNLKDNTDNDLQLIKELSVKQSLSAQAEARNFFDEVLSPQLENNQKKKEKTYDNFNILAFATLGLHQQNLDDLFRESQNNSKMLIVFRGVPENENLGQGIVKLHSLIKDYDPLPNIVIDPTLFQKYNITVAPTIIIKDKDNEIARVSGLVSPNWLLQEIDESDFNGDAGVKGNTVQIIEPDLIEVMKEKMAKINWEEKKQNALNNFWKKQEFLVLPTARTNLIKEIDPSVIVTADIITPDKVVIAKKGDIVNPLDLRPFTHTLIIFNPTSKKQLDLVLSLKDKVTTPNTTFLVTEMDRVKGWDFYREVTDLLDAPVFYLTPDIKARFNIERVPSLVTAKGKVFITKEVAIEDEEQQAQ